MIAYIKKNQKRLTDIQYILLAVILAFLTQIIFHLFAIIFFKDSIDLSSPFVDQSIGFMMIYGCIIAPALESLFIIFIIWILRKIFRVKKKIYLLIITSIIFTSLHNYSLYYMFCIFPVCTIIIYSYLFYKPKNLSSFKIMFYVHVLINIFALALNYLT
ncbi:type II CAAX prenyl endopeptidase Rce1 family protein [Clostridium tarantellae]|uniref:CAAX prenyl protease 2/Lysostaphin resistance protein A-like domain-containing protein n=1 Tax=Clostridium tarantellae TaxID=39493 RepID=A0A6I1MLX5_9CLOT|nr:CPBP family glutamic-type intramembrane protease [Clostridium tarantellae]MPQ44435.1 hypothetical protein [Clostridium tarantellae]